MVLVTLSIFLAAAMWRAVISPGAHSKLQRYDNVVGWWAKKSDRSIGKFDKFDQ